MAVLLGMSGEVKGRSFDLGENEVTIGRSSDNTIVLTNPTVSGHHCVVTRDADGYVVRDLESTNGTRVNTKDIKEARLRAKDLLQVGSVEFMFDDEASPAVETSAYAEAHVEVEYGPVAAPKSFANISPFSSSQRRDKRDLWLFLIAVAGILALAGVVVFFVKLITTG